MKTDDPEEDRYNEDDESKWKDNCRPDIKNAIDEDERERLADKLGPNWARVIAGLGDQ
jgi:hypothetical protein